MEPNNGDAYETCLPKVVGCRPVRFQHSEEVGYIPGATPLLPRRDETRALRMGRLFEWGCMRRHMMHLS